LPTGTDEFVATVRDLVNSEAAPPRSLVKRVVDLSPRIRVPYELRGQERGDFLLFGDTLRQRLEWIVGRAHGLVTSDLGLVAAAVGIAYDGNFLAYCNHASEGNDRPDLPDRFLSPAQCKGRGASDFRRAVRQGKRSNSMHAAAIRFRS